MASVLGSPNEMASQLSAHELASASKQQSALQTAHTVQKPYSSQPPQHITWNQFPCDICKLRFPCRDTLNAHWLSHLPNSEQYFCPLCYRVFDSKLDLVCHGKTNNICSSNYRDQCKQRSTNIKKPNIHKRKDALKPGSASHYDVVQRQHECPVCQRVFEDIFDLTSHVRTHKGPARSYSKTRKERSLVNTGTRTHTEDTLTLKPYRHSDKQVPVSALSPTAVSHSAHENENITQDIVTVKEDPEEGCFEESVSLEAAWMDLYKEHQSKDESLLRTILLQPPAVGFTVQDNNEQILTADSSTAHNRESATQDPEERCYDEGMTETTEVYPSLEHQIKDDLILKPVFKQPSSVACIVQNSNEQELTNTIDSPTTNNQDTVKVDPEERCFNDGMTTAIGVDHQEHEIKDELVMEPLDLIVQNNDEQDLTSTVDSSVAQYNESTKEETETIKKELEDRFSDEGVRPDATQADMYTEYHINDELGQNSGLLKSRESHDVVHLEQTEIAGYVVNHPKPHINESLLHETLAVKEELEDSCSESMSLEAAEVGLNVDHQTQENSQLAQVVRELPSLVDIVRGAWALSHKKKMPTPTDTVHSCEENMAQSEDRFLLRINRPLAPLKTYSRAKAPKLTVECSMANNENKKQVTVDMTQDSENTFCNKGIGPGAASAQHQIKDESVLGPSLLQPQNIPFVLQNEKEPNRSDATDTAAGADRYELEQDTVTNTNEEPKVIEIDNEREESEVIEIDNEREEPEVIEIDNEREEPEVIEIDNEREEPEDNGLNENVDVGSENREESQEFDVDADMRLETVRAGLYQDHETSSDMVYTIQGHCLPRKGRTVTCRAQPAEKPADGQLRDSNAVEKLLKTSTASEIGSQYDVVPVIMPSHDSSQPDNAQKLTSIRAIYKCNDCGKAYKTSLKKNLYKHSKFFKCSRCTKAAHHSSLLSAHQIKRKAVTYFKCSHCDYTSRYKYAVTQHLWIHIKEKSLKCNHCNYATSFEILLRQHLMTHRGDQPDKHGHVDHAGNVQLTGNNRTHTGEKPFKCSLCDYATHNHSYLRQHQRKHNTSKPFKCSHCEYTSHYKHVVAIHQSKHNRGKTFKCSRCDYATYHYSILRRHAIKHTTDMRFKCSHCDYTSHYHAVAMHQLKHNSGKPFKCSHCDYSSRNKRAMTQHQLLHMSSKPFKCSHCDYATHKHSLLKQHQIKHTSDKRFKCSHCDYTSHYKRALIEHEYRSHLRQHKMKYASHKRFKCSHCDYTAFYRSKLAKHELTHGETFKCSLCSYRSYSKSKVTKHELRHREHFKCSYCDYTACYKRSVTNHEVKHREPFKCSHCEYTSRNKQTLTDHELLHSSEKPFKCSDCDFAAARRYLLRKHEIEHIKKFKCIFCNYTDLSKDVVSEHQRTHDKLKQKFPKFFLS